MDEHSHEHKSKGFVSFYKRNYRKFLVLPILMFVLALFFIGRTISVEGTPIYRDISLKGGLSAVVKVSDAMSVLEFEEELNKEFNENSFVVSELFEEGARAGFIVDTDLEEEMFVSFVSDLFGKEFEYGEDYTSNFISPALSSSFFRQAMVVLVVSFVLMAGVVFLYFRELVPGGAVVLSAIFDVVVTVGVLDLFSVKISIAGVGALLMLIGYSIDTDILLTNRLVRERGEDYFGKVWGAFKTGVLMSGTTMIAGIAALILTNSVIIYQIALVLVVGLLVDFVSTWVQNSGILLWWMEKRKR